MNQDDPSVSVKKKMVHALSATRLSVLKLNQSKYYHLGTIAEYLTGLCLDTALRQELNLGNIVCSVVSEEDVARQDGVVMSSVLAPGCTLSRCAVGEYSLVHRPVAIGPNTILSNVTVISSDSIPAGFLYHTVPIAISGISTKLSSLATLLSVY